jgi:hypothetical protein
MRSENEKGEGRREKGENSRVWLKRSGGYLFCEVEISGWRAVRAGVSQSVPVA